MSLDLSIATICHPPYFKYLPQHLQSIQKAMAGRDIPVFLLNSQMDNGHERRFQRIMSDLHDVDVAVVSTDEHLPIGAARNRLFDRTSTAWTLFLDSDITLAPDYFHELERFFGSYSLKNVKGLAGGIGLRDATVLGRYEGLMDVVALVGKVEGIDRRVYEELFRSVIPALENNNREQHLWQNLWNDLGRYEGQRIRYMQGFNQLLHRDVRYRLGGFDDKFASAEDRDVAATILRHGHDILFAPRSIGFHVYNFDQQDIIRRKKTHGKWSAKFRFKHRDRPDVVDQYDWRKWMGYARTTINPPFPFNSSIAGRWYYLASFLAYAGSGIVEENKLRRVSNGNPRP